MAKWLAYKCSYVLGLHVREGACQKWEIEAPNFEPDPLKLDSVEKYFW